MLIYANTAPNADIDKILEAFNALPAIDLAKCKPRPVVCSNAIETSWVVDDSATYYLNVKLPWFGSGSLAQKRAPDGTRTEAKSEAETKLAEGLSDLIPMKEYLTSELVPSAEEEKNDEKGTGYLGGDSPSRGLASQRCR